MNVARASSLDAGARPRHTRDVDPELGMGEQDADGSTGDERDPGRAQVRRALRTALWIVGATVLVTGFVVVGLGILFAVGMSQWAANK